MERKKKPDNNKEMELTVQQQEFLNTFSTVVARTNLLSGLGLQYDGDRNIYTALGYPDNITFQDYWDKYIRQDIAGAIINRPIEKTWRGYIDVVNNDDESETLKNAWWKLYKDLKLKSKFVRADKLSSVGRYGIILLGFNDIKNPKEDWKKPVTKSAGLKLLYLSPYTEAGAVINTWVTDTTNERFYLPLTYNINRNIEGSQAINLEVHWSRVIHIPGETLDSEVYGVPILERVYNRLLDLQKLVGGSAEMYWRGARPGINASTKEGYKSTGTNWKTELEDQMQEFENNLRRVFITQGLDMQNLVQQIADPANHVDIQLQMISAITTIPKRILVGSERGELSSGQDIDSWNETIEARREELTAPQIIEQFVDRMMEYGILPKQDYTVEWENLHNPTDKDKADIGKTRAETLKSYSSDPMASSIVPMEMFFKFFLGLKEEQVEEMIRFAEEQMLEEQKQAAEDDKIAEEITAENPIEEAEVEDETPIKVNKKKKK